MPAVAFFGLSGGLTNGAAIRSRRPTFGGTGTTIAHLWFALSLDLFGGEISSNAASYFATGLKGRAKEQTYEDHRALDQSYRMTVVREGLVSEEDVPLRNAMNEVLRDEYVEDCQRGVDRWNKRLEEAGLSYRLRLPSKRFFRHIGMYAEMPFDPEGRLLSKDEWQRRKGEWIRTNADRAYVRNLMQMVTQPGQTANWLGKPPLASRACPSSTSTSGWTEVAARALDSS